MTAWAIQYKCYRKDSWHYVGTNWLTTATLTSPPFCDGLKIATWKSRHLAREWIVKSGLRNSFMAVQAIRVRITIDEV